MTCILREVILDLLVLAREPTLAGFVGDFTHCGEGFACAVVFYNNKESTIYMPFLPLVYCMYVCTSSRSTFAKDRTVEWWFPVGGF